MFLFSGPLFCLCLLNDCWFGEFQVGRPLLNDVWFLCSRVNTHTRTKQSIMISSLKYTRSCRSLTVEPNLNRTNTIALMGAEYVLQNVLIHEIASFCVTTQSGSHSLFCFKSDKIIQSVRSLGARTNELGRSNTYGTCLIVFIDDCIYRKNGFFRQTRDREWIRISEYWCGLCVNR